MNKLGIQNDFYFELLELINQLEDDFLRLENGFEDALVSSINRCFHSLKGNTGMLGLNQLETLFHRCESEFISQASSKQIDTDQFFNLLDQVKLYFQNPNE